MIGNSQGFADRGVADECLKHSDYTRVGLTFSRLFYIYLRSFCGWIPDLVIGV